MKMMEIMTTVWYKKKPIILAMSLELFLNSLVQNQIW